MSNLSVAENNGQLTGRKCLLILLGFFATVGGVDAFMMYKAISTFRGEVIDHPYEVGLAYNAEIVAAEAQARRRWRVDVELVQESLHASFRDGAGAPLSGLLIDVLMSAPADRKRDRHVELRETTPGMYVASMPYSVGNWDLLISAHDDGQTLFRSTNRVRFP